MLKPKKVLFSFNTYIVPYSVKYIVSNADMNLTLLNMAAIKARLSNLNGK